MTISDDQLDALAIAMDQAYGGKHTREEACDAGMRFLALMDLLATDPAQMEGEASGADIDAPVDLEI